MPFQEITFDKPAFPFKLCTTTFIYPADWVANARALGRAFDELELLLFESEPPGSLPSPETIQTLAGLSADLDFTWNVHLPIDLYPGHPDRKIRQMAVDVIRQVVDLTAPLSPTTHTLHLPGIAGRPDAGAVQRWQGHVEETLNQLISPGLSGKSLTVENLTDYPLEMARPLIEAFDLEVCLDIGHLVIQGESLERMVDLFRDRVSLMHIHGVADGRDHLGLDRLPQPILQELMAHLSGYNGMVCLEVFSKKHLVASLEHLCREWRQKLS